MHPRVRVPPLSVLVSFEAFSAAMTTAPLEDLHKTYDSDGENDLEDNYEGEDSDTDTEHDTTLESQPDGHSGVIENVMFDTQMDIDDPVDENNDHSNDSETGLDAKSALYDYFDARFDIDRSKLRPGHAASRHIDPELQATIDQTEIFLEQLSLSFQPMIEEQPMSTTIILANQAVEQVLMPYRQHGSQARLSESAMKFLSGGDRVRCRGRDGLDSRKDEKLKFVDVVSRNGQAGNNKKRDHLKRKADGKTAESKLKIRIRKRSDGTSVIMPALPPQPLTPSTPPESPLSPGIFAKTNDTNVFGERVGYGFQPASTVPLDGPKAHAESLSFRKTSDPLELAASIEALEHQLKGKKSKAEGLSIDTQIAASFIAESQDLRTSSSSESRRTGNRRRTAFTPLARSFSTIAIKSPTPKSPSARTTPKHACTIDPAANAALAREAFDPIAMTFKWRGSVILNGQKKPCMPTPGLLDALNNIIRLYNAEGRNMLSYYVRKYDTPADTDGSHMGAGPGSGREPDAEPPHALFRLGISQYLYSKVGNMIDAQDTDELGLNPEARRVLGAVWERHPSTQAWFDDSLLNDQTSNDATSNVDRPNRQNVIATSDVPGYPEHSDNNSRQPIRGRDFQGGLKPVEKVLLARACNISVETVEAYWHSMREKTKAWGSMKAWCEAQSRKRIVKAKKEGRW